MKLPASRSLVHLGLGAALATGLFVTPHAEAGTQMPPWKFQMLKMLEAGEASAGSNSGDDGFVSQGDLDLVLLNWGDGTTPPVILTDNQFGGGVSQNELDGVLLNWGNGTPPQLTPIGAPDPDDEYGETPYDIDTSYLDEGASITANSPDLLTPVYSFSSAGVIGNYGNSTSTPAAEIGVGQQDGRNSEPAAVVAVPEPASGLVLLGAAALSAVRRRRN